MERSPDFMCPSGKELAGNICEGEGKKKKATYSRCNLGVGTLDASPSRGKLRRAATFN